MKRLRELVNVLNPKRITYVDLFSNQLHSGSKLMQLYDGVTSGKIIDDETGASALYPKDDKGKTKFAKLKYHFKKRILNTVLLIEINNEDGKKERKKAFFDCLRTFVISYFLILLYARSTGIQLLKQKLKVMQHYDFTSLVLESTKILRQHYGVIVGDLKKASEYNEIIEEYLTVYTLETKVEGYYYQLMGHYVNDKSSKIFLHQLAKEYLEKLDPQLSSAASSSLIFKLKMIEIIEAMTIQNYSKASLVCENAVSLLQAKRFQDFTSLSAIYFQWITCSLQLKQYETCKKLTKGVMQYMGEGEYNWFKGMLVLIEVSFYTKRYDKAFQHFQKAVQQKNFKKLPANVKEEWRVYEAYFHLLMLFGKITHQNDFERKAIRLQKFLNEVPLSFQDKQGMNVPITIYSILVMIYRKQYDKVIDRSEALSKYSYRYLKGEEHIRTNCFIKILLYLCKSNYNYQSAKDKMDVLYTQLSSKSTDIDVNDHNLEIIPYEHLWKMVIAHLEEPISI